jgi:predicted O-methyltransferase YrrM
MNAIIEQALNAMTTSYVYTYPYHQFLFHLCMFGKVKYVLELGTYLGDSAKSMKKGILDPEGMIITIDQNNERNNPNFIDSKIKMITGQLTSLDTIKTIKDMGIVFDLLFIDAFHEYADVKEDYTNYKDFVKQGGFIILDDISLNEGMTEFWDELPEEKYDLSMDLDRSTGFGCFIK